MALVFYEKETLVVRRFVADQNQTDKELSKNHKKQPDEKVISIDMTLANYDPVVVQAAVDND